MKPVNPGFLPGGADPLPPPTNSRGRPWTSTGRRNLGCAGTGRANGGVAPPSFYERRYGNVTPVGHDRNFRNHWQRCMSQLLLTGRITPICYAIGMVLSEVSDQRCKAVWPGYKYLGGLVDRCPRTVYTYVHQLRELGMLDWDHRRKMNQAGEWDNAVSNLTVFRLPADVCRELGIRRRLWESVDEAEDRVRNERDQANQMLDERKTKAADHARALAQLGDTTFADCIEMLRSTFGDRPDVYEHAADALEEAWELRQYRP